MKDTNILIKKIKMLYVIVIGLIMLLGGMFYYFQNKFDKLTEQTNINKSLSTFAYNLLDNVISLNGLKTENFEYVNNPKDWNNTLKSKTGLSLDIPKGWKLDNVSMKKTHDEVSSFIITLNKSNDITFNDFVKDMYKKIYAISGLVESFKEGRGYYEIKSFSEATYNNMYYDYMTIIDGITQGPKVKVKVTDLEDKNQVKVEISNF